jgi:hypothetical protein
VTDLDRSNPSATRSLVWTLLVLCAVGNLAVSIYGGPLAVHLALGAATVLCIAALVRSYRRGRR